MVHLIMLQAVRMGLYTNNIISMLYVAMLYVGEKLSIPKLFYGVEDIIYFEF